MKRHELIHLRLVTLLAATLAGTMLGGLAAAENTVSVYVVSGGPLRVLVTSDAPFRGATPSSAAQHLASLLRLTVIDPRGTSEGWTVSVGLSDFVDADAPSDSRHISNRVVGLVPVGDPVVIAGRPRGEGGPNVNSIAGATFAAARTMMWAAPGFGSGDYQQAIVVAVRIPALSRIESYVATVTVAIGAAP